MFLKVQSVLCRVACLGLIMGSGFVWANDGGCPVSPKFRGHENTEWNISYGYHYTDKYAKLPRVLLVGDSICNGYQAGVAKALEGQINVTYWISSYCLTSKSYLPLLACYLDENQYDVIHFNNGLHSLGTDPALWQSTLRKVFALIRAKQPKAKLIWATSTPLKDPKRTARAKKLNTLAAQVVSEMGGIATDDLFALLDPLDREENWSDVYHHKPATRALESQHVAQAIRAALK